MTMKYYFSMASVSPQRVLKQKLPTKTAEVVTKISRLNSIGKYKTNSPPPPPPRGYDSSHFGWDQTHGKFIWHYLAISKATAGEKHLRVGHRGPVGRKTTQKPPQNTKKWKKIVKKRLFSRFGHFGQNSDFSRKKSKTGIFFDITKPPLAQIYPKSGL